MVATRREGRTIHYRLAHEETRPLMGALYAIFCAPQTPDRRLCVTVVCSQRTVIPRNSR